MKLKKKTNKFLKSTIFKDKENVKALENIFTALAISLVFATIIFGFLQWQTDRVNTIIAEQAVAEANKHSSKSSVLDSSSNAAPSTTPIPAATFASYVVSPDLPRYISIPKLHVNARVLAVGVNSKGALDTPSNVFDTAWYKGSSLPGQPGAMLIDGHISSWTSHGVFYGLNQLNPGDVIQITRGDGQVFSYQVVKTQVYGANAVDMNSALSPVDPSKPGLNLISCSGNVIAGTSEFNKRIVIYATQL
ncbi:MAG: class F sortase [Candidatus Saccharimonadales bacterium]